VRLQPHHLHHAAAAQVAAAPVRALALALILLLEWVAPAHAQTRTLRVEVIAPKPLAEVLTANLDIVRWSRRGDLTAGQLEQLYETAPDQVRELAATEGYFAPSVKPSLEQRDGVWVARFEVEPGEPTRVSSADVAVVGPIAQDPDAARRIEQARRAFRMQPGEVFRQADWTLNKERALRRIARLRYATARITESRAEIDPQAHTAALRLTIDSGPPVTIGAPQVNGLQRYPPSVVLHLNPIEAGAPYDEEALEKYQRRLLLSGYFASALVAADPDPAQPDNTRLLVTVVEAPARKVELGAGYSTDAGVRGQARYSDNNFTGRALRLSTDLYLDRLVQEGRVGLDFPRRASGWHYGLESKLRDEDIRGQEVLNWSVTGGNLYLVEDYESALTLQFLIERSDLPDGTRDDDYALFLNQRWLWNTLDDPINPRRGYSFQVQGGAAGEALLSTQTFGRVHLRGNYLKPLARRLTFALRGEAGAVLADTRDGIASTYLFRTGGDTSIRGYGFESLGVEEGGAIVGGRYLVVGSVELIGWFTRQWGAAVFVDAGNAWDEIDEFDPVVGYGTGVRWRSPLGNLSLDVAWGEQQDELRVHFSVGILLR
jgi:translocation and assembly module TamA